MRIGIIGEGAIGQYVAQHLTDQGQSPYVILTRPERAGQGAARVGSVAELPEDTDLMVDCAGHGALREHGAAILNNGIDLITVSVGALADADLHDELITAAEKGGAQLHLASGAIGALDCLRAASIGGLTQVSYVGRKPPQGWRGSPAEQVLDLAALSSAAVHFDGNARLAAMQYPKNANVAAAVALAGVGFDDTQVSLIADPDVTENIHEVTATGAFGSYSFRVAGKALPDNPRSSALAAMSVLAAIERRRAAITV